MCDDCLSEVESSTVENETKRTVQLAIEVEGLWRILLREALVVSPNSALANMRPSLHHFERSFSRVVKSRQKLRHQAGLRRNRFEVAQEQGHGTSSSLI
jgi:hypothetical protein